MRIRIRDLVNSDPGIRDGKNRTSNTAAKAKFYCHCHDKPNEQNKEGPFTCVLKAVLRIRIRDWVLFDPWIRDPE